LRYDEGKGRPAGFVGAGRKAADALMPHMQHDQFAKEVLAALLRTIGSARLTREVEASVHLEADVWFVPEADADRCALGLLGRLVTGSCLLEPFRNAPPDPEVRGCLHKLFALHAELSRRAEREKQPAPSLPRLIIVTPSLSARSRDAFGAQPGAAPWPKGVYFAAAGFGLVFVATGQLPRTEDTLWLRLLGRGRCLRQALREVIGQPGDSLLHREVMLAISRWHRIVGEQGEGATEEEKELQMLTERFVEEWTDWKQRAHDDGRAEEAARAVLTVLRVRGIAVPDAARERILAQKDLKSLERWHERAVVAASVAEVIDEPS
jgi:hypothetical protein